MAQVLVVHGAAGRLVCGVACCLKEQDEEGVTSVSAKWCLVLDSLCHCRGRGYVQVPLVFQQGPTVLG